MITVPTTDGWTPARGPMGTDRSVLGDEPVSDFALLTRVAAGEQVAFGELYDRFARRVFSLTFGICADPHVAADATQEAFLEVWRSARRFDPARGTVATWMLVVARHKAIDNVRREATVRHRTRPVSDEGWELPARPGADGPAMASVTAGHVRRALATLPTAHSRVMALAYYGGHTQTEVAAILGIPLGTVKSRTFQAMALLRAHLWSFRHSG